MGEHEDPALVVLGLLDDVEEPLHLLGVGARAERGLAHGHEVPLHDRGSVVLLVRGGERHPLVDLDELRELGEDVFLVAPQVRRCDLLAELARRELGGTHGEVGAQVADEVAELLDPVLQRRSGEQDGSLAALG